MDYPEWFEPVIEEDEWNCNAGPFETTLYPGVKLDCTLLEFEQSNRKINFISALDSFLTLGRHARTIAAKYMFEYYCDVKKSHGKHTEVPIIDSIENIWNFVSFGSIALDLSEDDGEVYVALQGGCDWEIEHGLQLVYRNGTTLCRVSENDGAFTNEYAYDDPKLKNVIYVNI